MIKDILTFCEMFHKSTYIPITLYETKTQKTTTFPTSTNISSVIRNNPSGFFHFKHSPDFFISNSFAYFGFVSAPTDSHFLILGPIFSTAVTDDTVREFMHELAIAPEHREMIQTFLKNIPVMSYNQIMQTLAYVHYLINDEVIDLTTHFSLNDKNKMTEISSSHPEKMMNARENQIFHNTYHYERLLLEHVQNGDTDKLEALLRQSDNLQRGVMSDNALREEKNIFITLATMVSRAAIQGGMDIEQAYQLSDTYVQECEKTQNINAIANLSYSMVHDFTARVATNKIPGGMSKEVFDCIQFISRNINEPIQVGDVIHYIGKSRSYMTKKFKEELGFDISSFIMRCKLEEAKSLLTYTDKSLSEISTYLCFSTQAYFQNVFKKKYGITPNEYRKRSQQI